MILISGSDLAYCTVSMVTADFDEQYGSMITFDSIRHWSCTTSNEPRPLDTLTMTGCSDARRSGSIAFVTRTIFNLLPVLVAVADTGSVTAAAAQLYLTQSAVSAALGRLKSVIDEPIVIRHGRGIVLTERSARLVAGARPHLAAMAHAALQPARF